MKKRMSQVKKIPVSLAAIFLVLALGIQKAYYTGVESRLQDVYSEQDLVTLNNGVLAAYEQQRPRPELYDPTVNTTKDVGSLYYPSELPKSLDDIKDSVVLHRKIANYTYEYPALTTNGGPTIEFTLCAAFKTDTMSTDTQEFEKHKKGRNCFTNRYYKGGSHISPQ